MMKTKHNPLVSSLGVRKRIYSKRFIINMNLKKELVSFDLLKFKYIFFYLIIRINNILSKY